MFSGKIEDYILFEDKEIIVCRKPAGIAVQNARIGAMDLESSLKNYLAKGLNTQITNGKMEKIYLAVTYGQPDTRACETEAGHDGDKSKSVVLEDYLKKDGRTNTSAVVNAGTTGAKKARLSYKVLGEAVDKISGKKKWLLRIHLDTGRHHQIRVQMAHAGIPLAGDRKYGTGTNVTIGSGSLALCAASLTFFHPVTGRIMKFETKPEGSGFAEFQM